MDETNSNVPKIKLNIGRTVLIGLAFTAICLFWEIYDSLMPLFLRNFPLFDKSAALTGIVMALDNILALILLPFMGKLSDDFPKIASKHPKLLKLGKRMPFIIVGTVLTVAALMIVTWGHESQNLALMLTATAFMLVFISLYRSPAVAFMPDITPKPIRSTANAIINIMGLVGGVTSLLITKLLMKSTPIEIDGKTLLYVDLGIQNWIIMLITGGLMLLAMIIMVIKVRENKFVEEKQRLMEKAHIFEDDEDLPESERQKIDVKEGGRFKKLGLTRLQLRSLLLLLSAAFFWFMAYNGAKTFYSTFYFDFLGIEDFQTPMLVGQIAGFLAFAPASIIGNKIGRKNTVLVGISICATGLFLASIMVFTVSPAQVNVVNAFMFACFILVGAGWATINVHSYVMSVEMANKHNTGAFTGLYYSFTMTAQILTPILVGLLADISDGFKYMFPYSFAFMVLAFVIMLFVKHGNAKKITKTVTAVQSETKA